MKKCLMNTGLPTLILVFLLGLFFTNSVAAQGGCGNITYTLANYEPCRYRLHVDNSSECYSQLRLLLDTGEFVDWQANTSGGWTAELVSSTEIMLTHSSGIIPIGASTPITFSLPLNVSPTMTILWDYFCPLGEGCFAEIAIAACSDPGDASISGTVYRECGESNYTNQPVLPGWIVSLADENENVLAEQQTGGDGTYYRDGLPAGQYVVKIAVQDGWTPKFPVNGMAVAMLNPSENIVQNFGVCPSCSCDSIYMDVSQEEGTSDTSTYYLNIANSQPYCFSFINIQIDSGQLVSQESLLSGWTVSLQGPNLVRLTPPGALVPNGATVPLRFKISGTGVHHVIATAYWDDGLTNVPCPRGFGFPGPGLRLPCACPGALPGLNLVSNGNFTGGPLGFSSGLSFSGSCGSGSYGVKTNFTAFCSGWPSLLDHTANTPSSSRKYLIIDGEKDSNQPTVLWKNNVNLAANTTYCFSFWWASVYPAAQQSFPVSVDIVDLFSNQVLAHIGTQTIAQTPAAVWQQSVFNWTSTGLSGSLAVAIRQLTSAPERDFGIDDICMREALPLPCTANAGPDVTICQGQSTTLTATGGPAYIWSNGPTTAINTVSPTVTTTYTVTVAAAGCTPATDQVTVTVKPLPTANAGPTANICQGQSTTLTATGGPNYVWSNGPTTATNTVTPTATTIYTVSVTVNGCTATAQVVVEVRPLPVASAGPDVSICNGQSTTLTATGGPAYAWSNGPGTPANTVTPSITTTYTVSVTVNGCAATDQVTVTVKPQPVANAGPDVTICAGQSTTLTATGGPSYAWSNGPGTATNTVTPSTTTTYTVSVTVNGCTATDQVTVTITPSSVANAGPDVAICAGQSTTLTATGGPTYTWSNGPTTATNIVSPSVTTTYTVTVATAGCSPATDQVTVTVNPLPVADAGPDVFICNGQSTTLTATGGPAYAWSNGPTTAANTVSPTTTTTYTVSVTMNGCTATDQTIVTVIPVPTVNAGPDVMICTGQSTTLTATGSSNYMWNNGPTTAINTVSPSVTTTYTASTIVNGCFALDQVTVTVNPFPVAAISGTPAVCIGQSTTLTASGGSNYAWSNGPTTATNTVSPIVTTTYTVSVTSNGCTSTNQLTVTAIAPPIVTISGITNICVGQSTTLTASGATSYLWNNGLSFDPFITVAPTTTTTYTLVAYTGAACSQTLPVTVTVNAPPAVTITGNLIVCPGSSTTLTASGGNTYVWSPGGSVANPLVVTPTAQNFTYTVTATDQNGCTGTATANAVLYCDTVPCACPGQVAGHNLVANGTFSAGNMGFGSDLLFSTGCNAGYYGVKQRFDLFCTSWNALPDHTNDIQRNFLIIDGKDAGPQPTDLWQNNIVLTANTNYCFSFWWASAYTNGDFNFPVEAYIQQGSTTYSLGITQITQTTTQWTQASFNWNSGLLTGPQIIRLRQLTGDDHRDFGIDDICMTRQTAACTCGVFSEMVARPTGVSGIPLSCGQLTPFGCPAPGSSIPITGKFVCQGNCSAVSAINWTLTGPSGPHAGTVQAGPYFSLSILPNYYSQPGTYTLTLLGNCDGQPCPPCVIQFTVNCPVPCPCQPADIQALQAAANVGFAHALWSNNCQACFSPLALSDCETVTWHLNTDNGPLLGTTTGNQSFCYNFTNSGTYTIVMVVSRIRADGSLCETFTYSKTVNITCASSSGCGNSVFDNPTFSEGAVEGGLNSGGAATGWQGLVPWGDPHEYSQVTGSLDGWAMVLTGNLDSADVLSSTESMCLEKGSGTVTLRGSINKSRSNIKNVSIFINTGDNFVFNVFNPASCFRIASVDVSPYDSSWFDLEIPYDLSNWAALDSCGDAPHGVLVKPIVYVTSFLGTDQGGAESRAELTIDNFCFDGATVAVNSPLQGHNIRIFPNPNPGTFNVELPTPGRPGCIFRIVGLTGQRLREQPVETGAAKQTIQAGDLPAGLYFLQVISEGRVVAVEKFVKK